MTYRVQGLDNYRERMDTLTTTKGAIKVYCEIAWFPKLRATRTALALDGWEYPLGATQTVGTAAMVRL